MNIKENLQEMKFKDIATELNEFAKTIKTGDSIEPRFMKGTIFNALQKEFSYLNMREIDTKSNKFQIEIPYANDFMDIKDYESGTILLIFSIRTKKTDRLQEVSATKKKYVHTKHENPITFSSYRIRSFVSSFVWATDEANDLRIISKSGRRSNDEADNIVKKKSVTEILATLPETFLENYRTGIVQPFFDVVYYKHRNEEKYNALYQHAPSYVKQAMDEREGMFDAFADYVIEEKLVIPGE